MNDLEINQTIAKYMGWDMSEDGSGDFLYLGRRWENNSYTESLDACGPVVSKLLETDLVLEFSVNFDRAGFLVDVYDYSDLQLSWRTSNKVPQLALATSLAKVIKDITK